MAPHLQNAGAFNPAPLVGRQPPHMMPGHEQNHMQPVIGQVHGQMHVPFNGVRPYPPDDYGPASYPMSQVGHSS
jgi:hypothetical protein